jgi:hypothetical protein
MKTTYQSADYDPAKVTARYVRFTTDKKFFFCEVGLDTRTDIRQGTVDESELPEYIAKYARERCGIYPSYVRWPF